MASEKFRRQLRQEARSWRQQNLIDTELYQQLASRYRFSELEQDAKNHFVVILMALGGILLGLAAITYVAANWQGWPRELRTVLLLAVFVGVNAAGFYLWQYAPVPRRRHLGQGLLLLGGLLLGANMALMSQMFHQSGNLHELYLVWGLGVLAMAYGLRLPALGGLALILLGLGYGTGMMAWVSQEATPWQRLIEQMPLAAAIAFTPLVYRCRSRVLFGLMALLVVFSLQVNLVILAGSQHQPWLPAVAVVLPPALLWSSCGVVDWLGQTTFNGLEGRPFLAVSRALAVFNMSLLFYGLAFHRLWQQSLFSSEQVDPSTWPLLIGVGGLGVIAIAGWGLIWQRQQQQRPSRQLISSGNVATSLGLSAAVVFLHQLAPVPVLAPFVFNLLLFGLAIGLIRDGLAMGRRGLFWGGMGLLVISILTRTVEYNTDLLLKALVFALCGTGIIVAGLWFERHVQLSPDVE